MLWLVTELLCCIKGRLCFSKWWQKMWHLQSGKSTQYWLDSTVVNILYKDAQCQSLLCKQVVCCVRPIKHTDISHMQIRTLSEVLGKYSVKALGKHSFWTMSIYAHGIDTVIRHYREFHGYFKIESLCKTLKITDLEYSWNFIRLSSINVALCDRTYMEKFAVLK